MGTAALHMTRMNTSSKIYGHSSSGLSSNSSSKEVDNDFKNSEAYKEFEEHREYMRQYYQAQAEAKRVRQNDKGTPVSEIMAKWGDDSSQQSNDKSMEL